MNSITIVTCYYKIKSKRDHEVYLIYINNLLFLLTESCVNKPLNHLENPN